MITFLYILCSLLLVGTVSLVVMLVSSKQREAQARERTRAAEEAAATVEARQRESEREAATIIGERGNRITELSEKLARSETRIESLTEQGERDKQKLEELQASMRHEFRNLASEMMEQKSEQFKKTNKEAMDALLDPLKSTMTEFRERVEKIYTEQTAGQGELREQLKHLHELNNRITGETHALTNALRGNSKVQGDWGEVILQTMLENSGLQRGKHYTVQQNLRDGEGASFRPDVILNLPGGRKVVVDSKVSLTAFVNYCSSDDPPAQERSRKEHLASFRRHVEELGAKSYQALLDESPDFVIMFVPNEPAFMSALQNDDSLWNYAYNKKVIISSPTNFFALLKIVDDLWKRDDQSRNALNIAQRGGLLYDKFVGFVESLESVGKGLAAADANYQRAIKQLSEGNGNLIGQAEKLRELGVKTSKRLSLASAPREEDDRPEEG